MVATAVLHQPSAQRTNTEIELKLELDPADVELVPALPLVRGAEPRSAEQLTVYYDTKSGFCKNQAHIRTQHIDSIPLPKSGQLEN